MSAGEYRIADFQFEALRGRGIVICDDVKTNQIIKGLRPSGKGKTA